jgi:tetratricopeptide (TPR) repeat protein
MGGNFAAAADQYRRAANLSFSEPTALRLIEALQRSGRADAADGVLRLFLQQNPGNVPAQFILAGRSMQTGDVETAIALYEGLRRRLGDNDSTILNNLAWAYAELGDYETAEPLARRAWALNRFNPATTDTLGWILFRSGRRAEGLVLLQQASRGAPSEVAIRARLQAARPAALSEASGDPGSTPLGG